MLKTPFFDYFVAERGTVTVVSEKESDDGRTASYVKAVHTGEDSFGTRLARLRRKSLHWFHVGWVTGGDGEGVEDNVCVPFAENVDGSHEEVGHVVLLVGDVA